MSDLTIKDATVDMEVLRSDIENLINDYQDYYIGVSVEEVYIFHDPRHDTMSKGTNYKTVKIKVELK